MVKKLWLIIHPNQVKFYLVPDPQKPGEYILPDHVVISEPIKMSNTPQWLIDQLPDYAKIEREKSPIQFDALLGIIIYSMLTITSESCDRHMQYVHDIARNALLSKIVKKV